MIGLDCLLRLANIPIILFSAEVPFTKYDFVDDVDGFIMVEMNRVNNLNWISPMRWTFSNVNYVDDCLLKVLKGKFCTFKTTYSFTVMLLTHLLSTFIAIYRYQSSRANMKTSSYRH